LAFVAGPAVAAAGHKRQHKATAAKTVTCATKTSIMIANGDTQVLPPAQQGGEYGTVRCAKMLGSGVQADTFTVPASGDTLAGFAMYFGAGMVKGTYDLTPQSTGLNFLKTDWTGTMRIVGGTGAYKGLKGSGTMVCRSLDGIHTTCTDRLKFKG
jgi:hypothetical protein